MDAATAVDRAYEIVRNKILSGQYPPRKHLRECELAADAGVSRTPIREALKRLIAENYVVFQPNRGAFVAERHVEEEADDAIGLRAVVEAYAAELAAARIGEAELQKLEVLTGRIQAARAAAQPERCDAASLILEFHTTLCQAARSDTLTSVLRLLLDRPLVAGSVAHFNEADWDIARSGRRELIRALRARDGRLASALVSALVLQARQVLRQSNGTEHESRPRVASVAMVVP